MNIINTPCLNCGDRHIGCHASCKDYLAFKTHKDEIKEMIHKKKQEEQLYYGIAKLKRKYRGRR